MTSYLADEKLIRVFKNKLYRRIVNRYTALVRGQTDAKIYFIYLYIIYTLDERRGRRRRSHNGADARDGKKTLLP